MGCQAHVIVMSYDVCMHAGILFFCKNRWFGPFIVTSHDVISVDCDIT